MESFFAWKLLLVIATVLATATCIPEEKFEAIPTAKLKSGYIMPMLGFGTGRTGEFTADAVREALKIGYRLIDTANIYNATDDVSCEAAIGNILSEVGIPRNELFITTKIAPDSFYLPVCKEAIRKSLEYLKVDYLDLVLIHAPYCNPDDIKCKKSSGTLEDGWKCLEGFVDEGIIRSIGLSNCYEEEIQRVEKITRHPISVLQNWFDPLYQDQLTRLLCKDHGIQYQGFSTLGAMWSEHGISYNPVLTNRIIKRIAKEYNCSESNVVLRWALENQVSVVPGSKNSTRIAQNFNSVKLQLKAEDLAKITSLNGRYPQEHGTHQDEL